MCKDCGCSLGGHDHAHTHADGTTHSHSHDHGAEHGHGAAHEHSHGHAHPALNDSKTVEVITKILSQNDEEAAHNRAHLDERGILTSKSIIIPKNR